LNISGNYNQTGGTVQRTGTHTAGVANGSYINLNGVGKTYVRSAGTLDNTRINYGVGVGADITLMNSLTLPSTRVLTVNGSLTLNAGVTVNTGTASSTGLRITGTGTLICGTQIVDGDGRFEMTAAGATIHVGSPNGITSGVTASGNIQNTGNLRSFIGTGNYVYNGTAAQVTGNGLPTTLSSSGSLLINNSAGVTLSASTSITAAGTTAGLILQSGLLWLGDNNLTVAAEIITSR